MTVRTYTALAGALLLLIACGGEERAGQPETDTTGTVQSVSETTTASATTTGESGGSVTALSTEDKEFVSTAGMGGLMEVQAANLALQKASHADVKAFAQRMVNDHGKANAELAQFATTKGAAMPTELAGDAKDAMDHLSSLSGAEFDKAYMQHMLADHGKAVAAFEKESLSGQDSDLRTWATNTLPTLKEHAKLAGDVDAKLK